MSQLYLKLISDGLAQSLRRHVGDQRNAGTFEAIERCVNDQLKMIASESTVKVRNMWSAMTILDKLTWWVVTMLMSRVGKFIRAQHAEAVMADVVLERYGGPVRTTALNLPCWANERPWELLVADVWFIPPNPAKSIKIDFCIGPEAVEVTNRG